MQEIDLIRVALAFSFFIYASVFDWRTRRVKDLVWMTLGGLAFAILLGDLMQRSASLLTGSLLLPLAFIFADIFWDRSKEIGKPMGFIGVVLYIVSFAWIIYVGYSVTVGQATWSPEIVGMLGVFILVIIFELFFMFDVIRGGADAKAVICLAILFPWYPAISTALPIINPFNNSALTFFPFALSVLFMGALISIFMPLYFLTKNLKAGRKITGRSFFGFMLPLDDVQKRFVWLIEWVENGETKFSVRKPRDSEHLKDDLEALGALGRKEVWVTYKIPFIIPLTVGMFVILTLGNPLFVLY